MKLLLAFLFLISFTTKAQTVRLETTIIATDIPENMGRGMVFSSKDSTLIKGNYIDSNQFMIEFKAVIGDSYYLKLIIPGYADTIIPFVANELVVQLEPIRLMSGLTLDAVQVTYEKPVFVRTMEGLTVNVRGTTLEELNTLFDILKASPKLSSPDDETIEIIGRGVPLILIDRQPIVSSEELKAIPASEVDKIDIITNPSAKYRAQGSGNGVIEVFTNNFTLQGYRAHIRADGGVNTQLKPQAGSNVGINLKKGKFSLNGNYGSNFQTSNNFGSSGFATTDSSLYSNSNFSGDNNNLWQYFKLKMGYDIAENQRLSFGLGGRGSFGGNRSISDGSYFVSDTLRTERSGSSENKYKWTNSDAFVNYSWDTDTIGSALEVNLNYSRRVSNRDNEFQTDFYDYQNQTTSNYQALATSRDQPNVGEVRMNYEHFFDTTQFKMDIGLDFSALFNEKKFNRYNNVGGTWVEDQLYTNSYTYQEQIGGVFAQISKKWDHFGFQVGLRGEYTRLDGYSNSLQQQFMDSSFILPFPNAGMLFEPNEKVSITAYYNSGIDRPSFTNYDPFVRILDSLSVEYGNPYLRPSYNHTIGMDIDLFYSYNLSLSYSRYNNIASTISFVDPTTYISSTLPWNADFNETYSLSVSVPINLKWLDGWNSFWVDYNNYVFTDVFGRDPFQNVTFGFHSYLTFKLPHDFSIMNKVFLSRWGGDDMVSGLNQSWGIRVTKKIKKPDMNFYFEVEQIIPNKYRSNSVNGNFVSNSVSQNRFTGFYIGIFYKFGRLTANTNIKESESGQSDRF